ncbi:MAG: AAA family ATPase [Planctomycetota bacterium]
MHVTQLKVSNVKRIKAATITPDGKLVVVSGRNAQGKSSVLDAIMYALAGGRALPEQPLRHGAKKGEITVNLGELVVTRTITPKGTTLEVKDAKGARQASPQALLDQLAGALTFDPLAFSQQPPRQQAETLRALTGLDLSDLDARRQDLYDQRTLAGRDVQGRQKQIEDMPFNEGAPAMEVSVADLAGKLKQVHASNDRAAGLARIVQEVRAAQDAAKEQVEKAKEQLANWQAALKQREQAAETLANHLETAIQDAKAAPVVDTGDIERQMAEADTTNRKVRQNQARQELEGRFEKAREEYDRLTGEIQAVDDQKTERLAETKMPIEGLAFTDAGVTYRDVPFEQCSTGERLTVSVAMAVAANPKLRIGLIREGSSLDEEHMRLLAELAERNSFQLWLEKVSEGGATVIIEDGMVKDVVVEEEAETFLDASEPEEAP